MTDIYNIYKANNPVLKTINGNMIGGVAAAAYAAGRLGTAIALRPVEFGAAGAAAAAAAVAAGAAVDYGVQHRIPQRLVATAGRCVGDACQYIVLLSFCHCWCNGCRHR